MSSFGYNSFNPLSHELICHYLNNKIIEAAGNLETESEINEVNICDYEPAQIPDLTKIYSTHIWHVISPVEKLRGNSQRTKRSTRMGHWKVTGKDSEVKDFNGNIVGFKKYLVFKENTTSSSSSSTTFMDKPQNNSTWIIHELHSYIQHPNKDAFVLCKLMKRSRSPPTKAVAAEAASPAVDPNIFSSFDHMQNFVEDSGGDDIFEDLDDIFSVDSL